MATQVNNKTAPSLNPYAAPPAVCPTCGSILQPQVDKQGNGMVSSVYYVCQNQEAPCNYRLDSSMQHINGTIKCLKPADKQAAAEKLAVNV